MELSEPEYQKFTARMKMLSQGAPSPFAAVEMSRKVFKEAFLGGEVLSVGDAPLGRRHAPRIRCGERNQRSLRT